MDITLTETFLSSFSANEQLILIRLLLTADDYGVVEFSDRNISKETGLSYQQVRTIHQKLLLRNVITNAQSNAVSNARQNFVRFCKCDCYKGFKRPTNAEYNATGNALQQFEIVWNLYDKKVGRTKQLVKKWCELPEDDRQKIMEYIPAYVALTEESYRKQFTTFLNQRAWENQNIYTNGICVPYGSFNPKLVEDKGLFRTFVEHFNDYVKNTKIPQVDLQDGLTEKRRVLFNIAYCLHFHRMREVMDKVIQSPRFNGTNGFTADFDFIFKPENFLRISEGRW